MRVWSWDEGRLCRHKNGKTNNETKGSRGTGNGLEERLPEERLPKPSLFYRWAPCTETMQEEGEASVAETHRVIFESTSSEIFIP